MAIDTSSALAEKFKNNRQALEAAVVGRGAAEGIDPYSALRALQKLNVADRYEMMQKAMQGQSNPPSVAQQTLAQAQQSAAPAGLAAMPVPEDTVGMARGGIIAFASQGAVPTESEEAAVAAGLDDVDYQRRKAESGGWGPEGYYTTARGKIGELEQARESAVGQGRGLALLQAANAVLQGPNLARGLGAAGAAFGESYGRVLAADAAEKRSLAEMRLHLADAERKEQQDLRKDARESRIAAEKSRIEAERHKEMADLEREKIAASERNAQTAATARRDAAASKGASWQEKDVQRIYEHLKEQNPKMSDAEAWANATEQARTMAAAPRVDVSLATALSAQITKLDEQIAATKRDAMYGAASPEQLQQLEARRAELAAMLSKAVPEQGQGAPAGGSRIPVQGSPTKPEGFQ